MSDDQNHQSATEDQKTVKTILVVEDDEDFDAFLN